MEPKKVNLSRKLVYANETITLKNVCEVVIQNYSTTKIDVVFSNIPTEVPPVTKVQGIDVPSLPYTISANGNIIEELTFEIKFPSTPGKVIIDCTSVKC